MSPPNDDDARPEGPEQREPTWFGPGVAPEPGSPREPAAAGPPPAAPVDEDDVVWFSLPRPGDGGADDPGRAIIKPDKPGFFAARRARRAEAAPAAGVKKSKGRGKAAATAAGVAGVAGAAAAGPDSLADLAAQIEAMGPSPSGVPSAASPSPGPPTPPPIAAPPPRLIERQPDPKAALEPRSRPARAPRPETPATVTPKVRKPKSRSRAKPQAKGQAKGQSKGQSKGQAKGQAKGKRGRDGALVGAGVGAAAGAAAAGAAAGGSGSSGPGGSGPRTRSDAVGPRRRRQARKRDSILAAVAVLIGAGVITVVLSSGGSSKQAADVKIPRTTRTTTTTRPSTTSLTSTVPTTADDNPTVDSTPAPTSRRGGGGGTVVTNPPPPSGGPVSMPQVTLNSPGLTNKTPVVFTGTCTDGAGPVTIFGSGPQNFTVNTACNAGTFGGSKSLNDGFYFALQATQTNSAGIGQSVLTSFTVDHTPPFVGVAAYDLTGGTVQVDVTCNTGDLDITVNVAGQSSDPVPCSGPPTSVFFYLVAPGTYTVTASQSDLAGNVGSRSLFNFSVA